MSEAVLPKKLSFLRDYAEKIYTMRPGRVVVEIKSTDLRKVVERLKRELGEEGFYLSTIAGTDYPSDKVIQVDYYITLVPEESVVVLRTRIPRDKPVIDSILDLVPGSFSGESETHDLLGVVFAGNKHLKRGFFVPADVAGKGIYPLRKDSGV